MLKDKHTIEALASYWMNISKYYLNPDDSITNEQKQNDGRSYSSAVYRYNQIFPSHLITHLTHLSCIVKGPFMSCFPTKCNLHPSFTM